VLVVLIRFVFAELYHKLRGLVVVPIKFLFFFSLNFFKTLSMENFQNYCLKQSSTMLSTLFYMTPFGVLTIKESLFDREYFTKIQCI
jgi:hypothetical protein